MSDKGLFKHIEESDLSKSDIKELEATQPHLERLTAAKLQETWGWDDRHYRRYIKRTLMFRKFDSVLDERPP